MNMEEPLRPRDAGCCQSEVFRSQSIGKRARRGENKIHLGLSLVSCSRTRTRTFLMAGTFALLFRVSGKRWGKALSFWL